MSDQNIVVYGTSWCGDCRRAKRYLSEQLVPFRWIDIDKDRQARVLVEQMNQGRRSVPTVVFPDGSILVEPSNAQLAQKLGRSTQAKMRHYDLVVIGGGACGLTAATQVARERFQTIVVERGGLGGQAGITDKIENVPGFAKRLTGAEFAKQLTQQARSYGVEIIQADVEQIEIVGDYRVVNLAGLPPLSASALLVATGATYRRLDVPGEDAFLQRGVHYCVSCDAPFYRNAEQVFVLGSGDDAIQAAILLAQSARSVSLLVPSGNLTASTSALDELSKTRNVAVRLHTTVTGLAGQGQLTGVVVRDTFTGDTEEQHPAGVFVLLGLAPNNALVRSLVALDPEGYVATGHDLVPLVQGHLQADQSPAHVRMPHAMETSVRGLFAAGDLRSGSSKLVASAVNEGSSAAIAICEYLRGD